MFGVLLLQPELKLRKIKSLFRAAAVPGTHRCSLRSDYAPARLGTALIIAVTAYLMLIMAGARISHMVVLALIGVGLVALVIYLSLTARSGS